MQFTLWWFINQIFLLYSWKVFTIDKYGLLRNTSPIIWPLYFFIWAHFQLENGKIVLHWYYNGVIAQHIRVNKRPPKNMSAKKQGANSFPNKGLPKGKRGEEVLHLSQNLAFFFGTTSLTRKPRDVGTLWQWKVMILSVIVKLIPIPSQWIQDMTRFSQSWYPWLLWYQPASLDLWCIGKYFALL